MSDGVQGHPTLRKLKVLLVEDHTPDAALVRMALSSGLQSRFVLKEVGRLSEALRVLEAEVHDVVLLDLGLPDSQGLATFSQLHGRFRGIPIVVLSSIDDDATTLDAVRLGAQDFLVKGKFGYELLARVIRHAIERQELLLQLERSLAYVRSLLHEAEGTRPSGEPGKMLAMCSWCKRIRDAAGRWQTIEEYLAPRSHSQLTHGACPVCVQQLRQGGASEGKPR